MLVMMNIRGYELAKLTFAVLGKIPFVLKNIEDLARSDIFCYRCAIIRDQFISTTMDDLNS